MSRVLMPHAYIDKIFSSKPEKRRSCLGIILGSKVPYGREALRSLPPRSPPAPFWSCCRCGCCHPRALLARASRSPDDGSSRHSSPAQSASWCLSKPPGPTISSVVLPANNSSNADSSFVGSDMRSPIFSENATYTKCFIPSREAAARGRANSGLRLHGPRHPTHPSHVLAHKLAPRVGSRISSHCRWPCHSLPPRFHPHSK